MLTSGTPELRLRKLPGWTTTLTGGQWFIATVSEDAPAWGRLAAGDRLLAVNGDERSAVLGPYKIRDVSPGETYRIDVERNGRPCSSTWSCALRRPIRCGRSSSCTA